MGSRDKADEGDGGDEEAAPLRGISSAEPALCAYASCLGRETVRSSARSSAKALSSRSLEPLSAVRLISPSKPHGEALLHSAGSSSELLAASPLLRLHFSQIK